MGSHLNIYFLTSGILCSTSLAILADNIDWKDARDLCLHLGVNYTKIQEIGSSNTTPSERIFNLIRFWTNSYKGELDNMEKEFIETFKEIDREPIYKILQTACSEKRTLLTSDF